MKKILFILLAGVLFSANAQVVNKNFAKVELYYKIGDYYRARSYNEKVLEQSSGNNTDAVLAYCYAAKINNALGSYNEMLSSFNDAKNTVEKELSKSVSDYCDGLVNVADAYAETGNFFLADKYAKKADSVFRLKKKNNFYSLLKAKKVQAYINFKMGFYNEALQDIPFIISQYERIINEQSIGDASNLSKKDLDKIKEEYASVLTMYGQVYFEKGNYDAADSILYSSDKIIQSLLGKKSHERVFNRTAIAKLAAIANDDYKTSAEELQYALKLRKKTIFNKGKSLKPYSLAIIEIYNELIKSWLALKYFDGVKKIYNQQEDVLLGAYGYNSKNFIFYTNKMNAEYYSGRIMLDESQKCLDKVVEIVATDEVKSPRYYEAMEMMYLYKMSTGQNNPKLTVGKDALFYLQKMLEAKKALYGENCLEYQKDRMEYADYITKYKYNFKEAEGIYTTAFLKYIAPQLDSSGIELPGYNNQVADYYAITENYTTADKYYTDATNMYKKYSGEKAVKYAVQLEKLATAKLAFGKYKEADVAIDDACDILSRHEREKKAEFVSALVTRVKIKNATGDLDEAKYSMKVAESISERMDAVNSDLSNDALDSRAYLNISVGKLKDAEKLLKENIKDKEASLQDGSIELISSYLYLAQVYLILGNFSDCENYITKALKISVKVFGENSVKTAKCYYMLQKLKVNIGDYEKAQEILEKIIAIYTAKFSANHIFLVESYQELANILNIRQENPERVDALLQKALEIVKNNLSADHPLYAETIKDIAKFYIRSGQLPQAEDYLSKAADILKEKLGKKNLGLAEISLLKADILLARNKLADAETNYEKAISIYGKSLNQNHPNYVSAQSKLARCFYMKGDIKRAVTLLDETTDKYVSYIDKYFSSLSEREKIKFWNLIKDDFEFYNFLAIGYSKQYPKLLDKAFNHSIITKSVLLNSSVKVRESILNSGNQELIAYFNDYIAKKENLINVISLSDQEKKEQGIDINRLQNEIAEMERSLSKSSEMFGDKLQGKYLTWQQLKNQLGNNEIAIEMIRARYFSNHFTDSVLYGALMVNNNKNQKFPDIVPLPNGRRMEKQALKYYRNTIKYDAEDDQSYRTYWEPINARIPQGSTVYFSPEGVYNQINLETLRATDGKYVIDKEDIIIVGNFTNLNLAPVSAKQKDNREIINLAVLVGNPEFYDSQVKGIERTIQQLPGTEEEAKGIATLFEKNKWDVILITDTAASEYNLKNVDNPRVLHIATHGFFKELASNDLVVTNEELLSPLNRSGVLLKHSGNILTNSKVLNFNNKDGILTASEAMNLYMDKTELVVLSACETGLGDVQAGEGVYGLQRSFLVAGSNSVVMSLFKVDDEATQQLMTAFYKNWIKTGDKRKSFIQAKKEIKKTRPEPIYWGAFVMIGN